jgi:RND family efflux transporter MFP subunit
VNKIIIVLLMSVLSLNAGEVYATFSVKADKSASLAFDASGVVASVNTSESEYVKKGEILASLRNADKKAKLEIAKTTLKYAKKDYERQLKVKDLIDGSKFDLYAFKYENAKNQLKYEESQYAKTYLKAPFNGVIFYKNVEVGDTVNSVQLKTVLKIQSLNARKLVLEFDQKYYRDVKVGDTFKYKIDNDSKIYTGKISKIYPVANANNRKIQAEVKAKGFMVGLFGDGNIITQK